MDRYLKRKGQPPRAKKNLYFIRHGESLHNAQILAKDGALSEDLRYMDASLTQTGIQQASALKKKLAGITLDLLVSSPLTRAIQTSLYATNGLKVKSPIVTELCAERLSYVCDIGSSTFTLSKRFPLLQFDHLSPSNAWWWVPNYVPSNLASDKTSYRFLIQHGAREPNSHFYKRVSQFWTWIDERPEQNIAVFAHGTFLKALISGPFMSNCELRLVQR